MLTPFSLSPSSFSSSSSGFILLLRHIVTVRGTKFFRWSNVSHTLNSMSSSYWTDRYPPQTPTINNCMQKKNFVHVHVNQLHVHVAHVYMHVHIAVWMREVKLHVPVFYWFITENYTMPSHMYMYHIAGNFCGYKYSL